MTLKLDKNIIPFIEDDNDTEENAQVPLPEEKPAEMSGSEEVKRRRKPENKVFTGVRTSVLVFAHYIYKQY